MNRLYVGDLVGTVLVLRALFVFFLLSFLLAFFFFLIVFFFLLVFEGLLLLLLSCFWSCRMLK